MRRKAAFTVLVFVLYSATLAAEVPVSVSPGSPTGALIGDTCPTFSWGAVSGAKGYELVVYRLGGEGEEARSLLSQRILGSALSWTPSLAHCLNRGGRYAWSVRAMGAKEESEWSQPNLFEVASGPSEKEFEEAVAVVRRYLDQEDGGQALASGATSIQPTSGGSPAGSASTAPRVSGGPAPLAAVAGDSALMVNGSPVVTVATFSGALCSTKARRYLDQGDGTVLDCNTDLIWLKDASCGDLAGTAANGRGTWTTGESAAAALADGTCGLTDGSVAGQWRQPTISELCSAWVGSGLFPCPSTAASDSLIDSSLGVAPYVVNAAGTGLWTGGDAFVGVQNFLYWSATENAAATAWHGNLSNGAAAVNTKTDNIYVWPVRSGQ